MNHPEINCDIISDLIPSYLEDICTDSTKKAVEEHTRMCENCRIRLEMLKNTKLTDTDASRKEYQFMKKVKQHYARKNALGVALLFFLTLAVLFLVPLINFEQDFLLYCVLFSTLTLGVFFLLSSYRNSPAKSRLRIGIGIAGAAGILYDFFVAWLLLRTTKLGTAPLGMPLEKSGFFFSLQLIFICILELLLLAYSAADSVKGEHHPGMLPVLNFVGCTLSLSFYSLLNHMAAAQTLSRAILQAGILVFGAGLLIAAIQLILLKLRSVTYSF